MTLIASIAGTVSPRLVYLHADTVGATVHPIDIYKEMRSLRSSDESLRKFDLFMEASGNVPKGGGKFTERYVILLNTRLVPYDTSHILTINGTIITDTGQEGIEAFDRSPLSPSTSIDIAYVPPQVEVVVVIGGSGLSVEQSEKLDEIHNASVSIVHVDPDNNTAGDGSPTNPYSSLANAVGYASVNGIHSIHIHSDVVVDTNLDGFYVYGISANVVIDLNGYSVAGASLEDLTISGSSIGAAIYSNCSIADGVSGISGVYHSCGLAGDLSALVGGFVIFDHCFSGISGGGRPSVDLLGSGTTKLANRAFSGGFEVRGAVTGAAVTIELIAGEVRFSETCTGGDVHVRGTGFYENLGTVSVESRALNVGSTTGELTLQDITDIVDSVWAEPTTNIFTSGSMGEYISKKLLTINKFIGLK